MPDFMVDSNYSTYDFLNTFGLDIVLGGLSGFLEVQNGYRKRFDSLPPGWIGSETMMSTHTFLAKDLLGTRSSFTSSSLGLTTYWIGGLIVPWLYPSHSPDSTTFFIVDRLSDALSGGTFKPISEKETLLPVFYPKFKNTDLETADSTTTSKDNSKLLDFYKECFKAVKRVRQIDKDRPHTKFRLLAQTWKDPFQQKEHQFPSIFGSQKEFEQASGAIALAKRCNFFSFGRIEESSDEGRPAQDNASENRTFVMNCPSGGMKSMYNPAEMGKYFQLLLNNMKNGDSLKIVQEWSGRDDYEVLSTLIQKAREKNIHCTMILNNPQETPPEKSDFRNAFADRSDGLTPKLITLGVGNPFDSSHPGEHLDIPAVKASVERWVKTIFALVSRELQTDISLFLFTEISQDGNLGILLSPERLLKSFLAVPKIAFKITVFPLRLAFYSVGVLYLKVMRKDKATFEMPALDSKGESLRYPAALKFKENPIDQDSQSSKKPSFKL